MLLLALSVVTKLTLVSSTIFCPIVKPTGMKIYITASPSESVTGQSLLQCALLCGCSSSVGGAACQFFNYNAKSMTCNLFKGTSIKIAVDNNNQTVAYQVRWKYLIESSVFLTQRRVETHIDR